jgi:2-dehydropantoate 2-reductase
MNFDSNCKIVVAGLGGVGGFLGAALASTYPNVTFYARGARKESLKNNGITLTSEFIGNRHATAALVTDNAKEIGIADILIISVKNYSLEEICSELSAVVDEHTIIVPVLNGIDPAERTRTVFKKGTVVDSLIYIISASQPDFSILQQGNYATLRIGTTSEDTKEKNAVQTIYELFTPTGVTCIIEEDIEAAIWKKYIFNCAFNILTAAYSADVKDLRANPTYVEDMRRLMEEAVLIAKKKNVTLPEDFVEERMQFFLNTQSPEGTSSMRRDIDAKRPCELDTFSGYLLNEAPKYKVELPKTLYYYGILITKIKTDSAKSDFDSLVENLNHAKENYGEKSKEVATCLYQLGMYSINHGNKMKAMEYLGDSLYIRRDYYTDDDLRIQEIYYALEQTTFM